MLDVAIVGGGLCGLALARALGMAGRGYALYEARERAGGRILSVPAAKYLRVDLGPTWYWPAAQPRMAALLAELDLQHFAQYDEGTLLRMDEAEKAVPVLQDGPLHDGARRLAGGMASLVEALVAQLPDGRLFMGHALQTIRFAGGHVELELIHDGRIVRIQTRHVVLALPPRLAAERIRFEPALDAPLREALQATPTWMATQAKAVLVYEQAAWRRAGHSGNALVTHEAAVLGEVWDASESASQPALAGFIALPPAQRRSYRLGLPMLLGSQMQQLFGPSLEELQQHCHDWAEEPWTCASLDLAAAGDVARADSGDALLRQPQWQQHLFFGGSETAAVSSGHLEGALVAAENILRQLPAALPDDATQPHSPQDATAPTTAVAQHANAAGLARFRDWVRVRQPALFEDYRRRINLSLATQAADQLTQRAMLGAMEQLFADALVQLAQLPFDTTGVTVEDGRCALTPQVQAAFQGCMQQLLDEVTVFNGTSCALSNFPGEDRLSKEYTQAILRDLAAAWREFSLQANALLLGRRRPAAPAATARRLEIVR